jgi:hypothetical protein
MTIFKLHINASNNEIFYSIEGSYDELVKIELNKIRELNELVEKIKKTFPNNDVRIETSKVTHKGSVSKEKMGSSTSSIGNNYEGLVGGITMLIEHGFFESPKTANEVYVELKKETYYYSLKSVDGTLRNNFVAKRKTLTRIKEVSVWKYVLRK